MTPILKASNHWAVGQIVVNQALTHFVTPPVQNYNESKKSTKDSSTPYVWVSDLHSGVLRLCFVAWRYWSYCRRHRCSQWPSESITVASFRPHSRCATFHFILVRGIAASRYPVTVSRRLLRTFRNTLSIPPRPFRLCRLCATTTPPISASAPFPVEQEALFECYILALYSISQHFAGVVSLSTYTSTRTKTSMPKLLQSYFDGLRRKSKEKTTESMEQEKKGMSEDQWDRQTGLKTRTSERR